MNGCKNCSTGYVHDYTSNGPDFNVCKAEGTNTNCLVADSNNVC